MSDENQYGPTFLFDLAQKVRNLKLKHYVQRAVTSFHDYSSGPHTNAMCDEPNPVKFAATQLVRIGVVDAVEFSKANLSLYAQICSFRSLSLNLNLRVAPRICCFPTLVAGLQRKFLAPDRITISSRLEFCAAQSR